MLGRLPSRDSLRGQLLWAQAAILLPLALTGVVGWLLLLASSDGFERSVEEVATAAEIGELHAGLATAQRMLTQPAIVEGDPRALGEFALTAADIDARLGALVSAVPDELADDVRAARQDWRRGISELRAYVEDGEDGRTLDELVAVLSTTGGRFLGVTQRLSDVTQATAEDLSAGLTDSRQRAETQQGLLLAVTIAGLVAAIAIGRRLQSRLTVPLADLQDAANRFASEELGHRVPTPRLLEFRTLGTAFNQMAERLQTSRALLARNEQRFRALVQKASDVVIVTDAQGEIQYVSPSIRRMLGVGTRDRIGTSIESLVHPEDAPRIAALLVDDDALHDPLEVRMAHSDGRSKHVEIVTNNLLHDPVVGGIVLTCRDVTERSQLRQRLSHQAFHDPLTGMANRELLRERLAHALTRRPDGNDVAVILIDLDDFKTINDSLGHAAGDDLLRVVADRLQTVLRPSDTAARIGGDEFAVLVDSASGWDDAWAIAQRLLSVLQPPVSVEGVQVYPQGSFGVAVGTPGTMAAEELLRRADTAMYQAKGAGKNTIEGFTTDLQDALRNRLELRADLQDAIEHGQLELHYQPTVVLATGAISGVEALIRWRHPERGLVSPGEFIPLAEDTGLIVPIGQWVLEEACRQAVAWQSAYPESAPRTMNVNVSPRQLVHGSLVDEVEQALASSGLQPQLLVLEITESVFVDEADELLERLHALKRLGVRLAIDDFGTGYSSLSYLQRLPVDVLKVDKLFVDGLADGEQEGLVDTILSLARLLDLEAVAEGVEHAEQATVLQALRCDLAQGYLYGRPLHPTDFTELLLTTPDQPALTS